MGLSLGVFMRQGATQNLIGSDLNGTSDELERNIFAHTRSGVWDDSRMIDGGENKIVGNWFGMDAFARPGRISGAAIRFSDSGQNHEIRRNQVSWNGEGILVSGTATFAASSGQNCILGNDVGLLHEGRQWAIRSGVWEWRCDSRGRHRNSRLLPLAHLAHRSM